MSDPSVPHRDGEQAAPLSADEIADIFAPHASLMAAGTVLAVSGGSDSMALMHLAADWLHSRGLPMSALHIASIDHGLRATSAEDAAFVVAAAAALGFPAHVRRWDGPKPAAGRAEAARAARYALLADVMREVGARTLLTAHTADDQAETLLMRLARGSGIDGLAAMPPIRRLDADDDLMLVRPLLGIAKARLVAHLRQRGVIWREDPTNLDAAYERPRLREAQATLAALGLSPAQLGRAARRLRRAKDALEHAAADLMTSRAVRIDPLGFVTLDLDALLAAPEEIALRVLRRCIEIAGGAATPVPFARLEELFETLRLGEGAAWTLARAALRRKAATLVIEREPGREPPPRCALVQGETMNWDGRFQVSVRAAEQNLEIGPLGGAGLAIIDEIGRRPTAIPARTLHAVPSIWRGSDLVAVPLLGVSTNAPVQLDVHMQFLCSTRRSGPARSGASS